MKRIFLLGLAAAAVLASCEKKTIDVQVPEHQKAEEGHYVTRTLVLGEQTKATTAFSGEELINDATIFVYQKNNETGTVIDYERQYITGNTTSFDLYFSDQTEYTYSFAVWANMGELTDEPVAGEILFSNEKVDDIQMRGTVEDVAEADASIITISLVRYVGKTIINKIELDWTHKMNALKTFEIVDIYVSDAAETDATGAPAYYNLDCVFTTSSMDGFLYDGVNEVLADEGVYDTDYFFYAYESADTELVIKAELDNEVMYYHFPISPADNTVKAYNVKICQIGAEDPDGELPEEAIVVSAVTLTVEAWGEQADADVSFESGSVDVVDQVNP